MLIQLVSHNNKKGFVLIYAVILTGSVILAMALYFSWLAAFSVQSSIQLKKSEQARYLADTCAEIALQKIWDDKNFTGSGNFSGYGGSCTYQVNNLGGDNREVRASGTISGIIRKAKISINKVGGLVSVTTWQEVGDF